MHGGRETAWSVYAYLMSMTNMEDKCLDLRLFLDES